MEIIVSNCKMFVILVVCMACTFLSACGNGREETVSDFCKQYVPEYEVVQNNDDGSATISVTAPDFEAIAKKIVESGEEDLNVEALENTIEANPEDKKEYVFSVDNVKTVEIEKAFLQQVSYELASAAIKKVDYTEDWSTKE